MDFGAASAVPACLPPVPIWPCALKRKGFASTSFSTSPSKASSAVLPSSQSTQPALVSAASALALAASFLGLGEGLLQLGESRLVAGAFVVLGLQLRLQLGDALVAVRDVALQLVDVGGVLALGRLGVLGLCALSLSGVLGLDVYLGVLGLCALGRGGACFFAHVGSLPGTRGASPLFGEDGRAALTGLWA